jgi:hypothetical protein
MVSMKMSKKEAKEQNEGPSIAESPSYPYGLSLSLDDDTCTKLGISDDLNVGDQVTISAKATVTSKSGYQTMVGKSEHSACLQITDMEVSGAGATKTTKALYDKK